MHPSLVNLLMVRMSPNIYLSTDYQSLNNELGCAAKDMFFHDLKSLTITVHFMLSLPTFFSLYVCVCGLCCAPGHRGFAAGGREVPRSVQTGSDAFPYGKRGRA